MLDPSSYPIVGPGSPYINPTMLTNAPTGISWSTIPFRTATPDQQLAEQMNICVRATAMVDEFCNQPLRATIDTEEISGPGEFRCQTMPNRVTRIITSRLPVVSVLGGRISSASAFPRSWQDIPADQWDVEVPMVGVYGTTAPGAAGSGGQAILLAPGWCSWAYGRMSSRIEYTLLNGWPHGSLTAPATRGQTSIQVDDITGWIGAVGVIYSGGSQETITATAVTPDIAGAVSGSGTLTVPALSFDHQIGDIVTTLPGSVTQATILFAAVQALTRGATSTAVQSISGGANSGGGLSPADLRTEAQRLIADYRRRI